MKLVPITLGAAYAAMMQDPNVRVFGADGTRWSYAPDWKRPVCLGYEHRPFNEGFGPFSLETKPLTDEEIVAHLRKRAAAVAPSQSESLLYAAELISKRELP